MGLFKKIADYQGTTHGVDPTGHDHSESESWLSTIVNRLQTAINGKADVEHTHSHIDDGESQVYVNGEDGIIGIEVSTQQGGYEMEITPENAGELIALLEGDKADKVHNHTASAITDFANAVNAQTKKSITINEIGGSIVITCEGGFGNKQGAWRADITYAGTNYKGGGILVIKNDIHTDPVISYNGYETIITDEYIYRRYTNWQTSEAWTKTKIDKNPVWGDITGLLANQTDLQTALDGKANTNHTQAISTITGLQSALDGKASTDDLHGLENIVQGLEDSKADVEHTQAISTITGLQSALDGKLDANILEMSATADTPIVVDDMPVGKLVLIDNSGTLIGTKLRQLIVTGAATFGDIHYHLNSGDLTNRFFLVRRFTWNEPMNMHHLIEVVGAWD